MDYSTATKKQLYEIALDENNRLVERYAAVKELQRRRMKGDDSLCRN
ncbi:hypothetical protein SAMN05444673_2557 [Bacillus sp. OV166]|nr:hypothetical protein [Bacillus sp. OV166]SMQ75900.1 hypothetical protein SAMN05444673_2557 [Bacillus sp. OV166]